MPIVDEAASFDVTMLISPVVLMPACRLFAASAVLSWLSVEIWPAPVPKVMLVAVPPPVAPIVSVWPLSAGGVTLVVPAERPKRRERAGAARCDDQILRRTRAQDELAGPLTVEAVVSAGDAVDRGERRSARSPCCRRRRRS